MSETLLKPDVGDAELITAVRGGDVSAYGTLFERHVDAARRLARQLTSPSDADDLVSDAFAKVLRVLQNGGGPDLAFRAYLLTAVRRLHVDKIRAGAKLQTTDDLEKFDPGVPFRDTAVEGFENSAAAAAFASLPERWQLVLWHTEVEGQKPAEVAELLGMSANSVSALAYRAREGLRQAFLNSHIGDLDDAECRWTHDHLGPYIRNGVSKRDGHKVEEHLDGCRKCMAIYLELTEVNSNLSGILAPIILGAAATGYLASGGAVVKAGFLAATVGRVRDGVTSNVPLSAAIGVAAVSTVVGVSVAISLNQGGSVDIAEAPKGPVASSSTTPGATDPSGTDPTGPEGNDPTRRTRAADGATDPSGIPDTTLTDPATGTTDAAGLPTEGTTDGTTDGTNPGGTDPGTGGPGTGGPGTGGPGTGGPGTGGHAPVTQPEFDVDVPQGERSATIPISRLVQDEDGDVLRFVDASLQDPAHGSLTIGSVTVPARGTAVAARAEQALVYVAERGWGGRDLVYYRVTDGDHTVRGSFRIRTVNDAPVANDEDETTPYGEPLTVDLLANDTDPDGDPLTLFSIQQPEHGKIERAAGLARLFAVAGDEGVVTYTPNPGWDGTESVTYVVDDGHHQATATLTVTTEAAPPVNRAPVAEDDSAITGAGQSVIVDVLANDTDADGDKLSLVSAGGAQHGTAVVENGKVTYTPADGWAGPDTVTYVVSDGTTTATGTLRVTTNAAPPTNHAPATQDDVADTGAGQQVTVDVLANDTDPDGDPLTLVSTRGAQHGTAEIVDGKVVYTPDAGWAGDDTLTYVVSDGDKTATGTLTVTTAKAPPVNHAPETQPDFADTGAGQQVTVDVLANDTDPDGDTLTLASAGKPAHGTAEVVDGKLVYTPDAGWSGAEDVTYTVSDGDLTATGTLTVTTAKAPPVNRAPETQPDFADTGAGQQVTVDVLANDTDPDGDPLRLVSATGAGHGTAAVEEGKLVYTPEKGWAGVDTVTYTVTDGDLTATGTLTVTTKAAPPVNRAPETQPDFADTGAGQAVTVDVLANDTDPDGDPLTLTDVTDGSHGTAQLTDGRVTYTPEKGWAGVDTVTYTVSDGDLAATGTLTITTAKAPPVNRAPRTVEDTALTDFETTVTVDVLSNDTDPDDDPLTLVSVDGAEHGTATVEKGQVVYLPAKGWSGADTVTYVVSDGSDEATGTLHVTTRPRPNQPPTAVNDTTDPVDARAGGSVTVDVVANDTDPDGDALAIDRVLGTHHGTVAIRGHDLVFTYADDFVGTEDISYVVTDGQYESTATLRVTVRNDAPVSEDDTRQEPVKVGESTTIDVLANDTDANGDALTLIGVTAPARGTATIQGGAIVYTPDTDADAGPDTFTYTVRDARGGQDTARVRLTVARPVRDVAVSVIEGERDSEHVHLTARITGYPEQGHVRLDITGQAVNAIVDGSLPSSCSKASNAWVCDLDDLTGERRDISLQLTIRGQVRTIRFQVTALNFTEPAGSGGNNAAEWPSVG